MEKGKESMQPLKFDFHMHHSGLSSEAHATKAINSRGYAIGRAFAFAALLLGGFSAFVQIKNRHRFEN